MSTPLPNPYAEPRRHINWNVAFGFMALAFFTTAMFGMMPTYVLTQQGLPLEARYTALGGGILSLVIVGCMPKLSVTNKLRWPVFIASMIVIPPLAFMLALAAAVTIFARVNAHTFWSIVDYYLTITSDAVYWREQFRALFYADSGFITEYTVGSAIIAGLIFAVGYALNPFGKIPMLYDARFATIDDIERMAAERKQIVMTHGKNQEGMCHLGIVSSKFRIALRENLSTLVLAPVGTGKTAGYLIPTILSSDNVSLVIHDLKPELADITSFHRSRISHTVILDWGGVSDVLTGQLYPRWNPLSPKCIPGGQARDLYIDRICNALIPDSQSGDKFWTASARNGLAGFIHFLVAQVNDHADYENIPAIWHGKEASLPMLVDWITEATLAAEDKAKQDLGGRSGEQDTQKEFFLAAANKAKEKKYPYRAVQELVALASSADKTRSGTLATMTTALGIFKNEGVRNTLSSCDIDFADLHGVRDETKPAGWKPYTIYIRVRIENTQAYAPITAMFLDTLGTYLTSYGPKETDDRGRKHGPFDVRFCIDEFPQLPPLQSILSGPAVARSKNLGFCLVAQDFAQIASKYKKEDVEILKSTTSIKIVFTQNNEVSAKVFSDMIGNTTIEKKSESRPEGGMGKNLNLFPSTNISRSLESKPLMAPQDIMSMPAGKHLILVQGYQNRPIFADTPMYYEDKAMLSRAFNPRDPARADVNKPVNPTPPQMAASIAASIKAEDERRTRLLNTQPETASDRFYIATPKVVASTTLDEHGENYPAQPDHFAYAHVKAVGGQLPATVGDGQITDFAAFMKSATNGIFVLWDKGSFDEFNQRVVATGLAPVDPTRVVMLDEVFERKQRFYKSLRVACDGNRITDLVPSNGETLEAQPEMVAGLLPQLHNILIN